jgi:hypothetical protein
MALLEPAAAREGNSTDVSVKYLSIAAIVIGILMEVFMIGSELSLGTGIAAVGIFVFVYDFFQRKQGPKA